MPWCDYYSKFTNEEGEAQRATKALVCGPATLYGEVACGCLHVAEKKILGLEGTLACKTQALASLELPSLNHFNL